MVYLPSISCTLAYIPFYVRYCDENTIFVFDQPIRRRPNRVVQIWKIELFSELSIKCKNNGIVWLNIINKYMGVVTSMSKKKKKKKKREKKMSASEGDRMRTA